MGRRGISSLRSEIPKPGRYPGIKSIIKACKIQKIAMSDWFIITDEIQ